MSDYLGAESFCLFFSMRAKHTLYDRATNHFMCVYGCQEPVVIGKRILECSCNRKPRFTIGQIVRSVVYDLN